jgi:hypothetical protein
MRIAIPHGFSRVLDYVTKMMFLVPVRRILTSQNRRERTQKITPPRSHVIFSSNEVETRTKRLATWYTFAICAIAAVEIMATVRTSWPTRVENEAAHQRRTRPKPTNTSCTGQTDPNRAESRAETMELLAGSRTGGVELRAQQPWKW